MADYTGMYPAGAMSLATWIYRFNLGKYVENIRQAVGVKR